MKQYLLSFLLGIIFLAACKNEGDFGLDVQPEGSQIGVFTSDTFKLKAKTVRIESLVGSETTNPILGAIHDPIFGVRKASVLMQIRIPTEALNFGDVTAITVDSVILAIRMAGIYSNPDKSNALSFDVFKLEEVLSNTTNYFTNQEFKKSATAVGGIQNYIPNITDSIIIDGVPQAAQMRIPLDKKIGEDIINADASVFVDNTNFINFFNGLIVEPSFTPSNEEGALLITDAISQTTQMTIYYRDSQSRQVSFLINESSVISNLYEHDLSGTDLEQKIDDEKAGEENLYISSMGGTAIRLKMPELKELKEQKPIIINRAIVEMHIEDGSIVPFNPNTKFFAAGIDSEGKFIPTPDFLEGTQFTDGNLRNNASYRLNITRYMQWLVDERLDFDEILICEGGGLLIEDVNNLLPNLPELILSANTTPYRTIVQGTSNSGANPLKLVISYTVL